MDGATLHVTKLELQVQHGMAERPTRHEVASMIRETHRESARHDDVARVARELSDYKEDQAERMRSVRAQLTEISHELKVLAEKFEDVAKQLGPQERPGLLQRLDIRWLVAGGIMAGIVLGRSPDILHAISGFFL